MFSIAAFALASALAASATEFNVSVGAGNQLVFDPPSVTAGPGDLVHFAFQNKNHSVTQSSFGTPCIKSPNGIDSGFMFIDPNAQTLPVWTINVSDTTPLWFYCAQTNPVPHCQAGMVFAVNPTADKTFDAYQANAKAGGAAPAGGNSTLSSGVIPAPTSLPTGGAGAPGASGVGAGAGGLSTSVSNPTASTSGSAAGAASTTANPNGAVGMNSAGAVSLISLFAAVAGFML